MVNEQGANIGVRLYISFIKWLVSMAFILSIVKWIQPAFRYYIKTGVFFIGTKFQGDMRRSCSVVTVKKCEFTKNKQGVGQCFHLHAWAIPKTIPGWVEERILPFLDRYCRCGTCTWLSLSANILQSHSARPSAGTVLITRWDVIFN